MPDIADNPPKMPKKCYIVVGAARSGTSMTAGILSHLGVYMGMTNNIETAQNPKGGYEDVRWNVLYNELWHDKELNINADYSQRIKGLIADHEAESDGNYGFKLTLVKHCLADIAKHIADLSIIIVTRNPHENARSWIRHMADVYGVATSLPAAVETVSRVVADTVAVVDRLRLPHIFVTYEDIKADPISQARKIAAFIGTEFTGEKIDSINQFIDREYSTI